MIIQSRIAKVFIRETALGSLSLLSSVGSDQITDASIAAVDLASGAARGNLTDGSGALDISGFELTLPATLPASSGVNLTALNATQLTSGTVPDARVPATIARLTDLIWTNISNQPAAFPPTAHEHDAADVSSGTFDVARIPVLPSQNQEMSSGGISDLTLEQQDEIAKGTIVTTTDGKRWVYSGTGSKALEASYVFLADVSPEWAAVANKPTLFDTTAAQISDATAGGRALITAANAAAQRSLLSVNNVDNTSDANKPVSSGQQTALDAKADLVVGGVAGNIATLDLVGNLLDSGLKLNDLGQAATDLLSALAVGERINQALDGLTYKKAVISFENNPAVLTPASGDRHLVGTTPVGDWIGQSNAFAEWNGAAWAYEAAINGDTVVIKSENAGNGLEYRFAGTGWEARPALEQHNHLQGRQGGTTGEYYHLSQSQYESLTASDNLDALIAAKTLLLSGII